MKRSENWLSLWKIKHWNKRANSCENPEVDNQLIVENLAFHEFLIASFGHTFYKPLKVKLSLTWAKLNLNLSCHDPLVVAKNFCYIQWTTCIKDRLMLRCSVSTPSLWKPESWIGIQKTMTDFIVFCSSPDHFKIILVSARM